jgi:hypothetical protein
VTIGRPVSSRASASRRRPSHVAHGARGGHDLVARLDGARAGDQAEVLAADPSSADLQYGRFPHLRGRELVRLEDRHDLLDAGRALEAETRDVLAVADGADHRHLLAARGVGLRPAGLDALDDGLDLVLGRRRFHHDHHQRVSWCFNSREGYECGGGWRSHTRGVGARSLGTLAGRHAAEAPPAESA